MPPKRRTKAENRALPQRWEWHNGKIHYQIPPALAGHPAFEGRKRRIVLGATLTEAHRKWAEIQAHFDTPVASGRFPDVAQAYRKAVLPTLSGKTQADYEACLARLAGAFQEFRAEQILPHHCVDYVDANMHRVRQARYDVRVMSAVLTWCAKKGIITRNPLVGQLHFREKRYNPKRRIHYVTDEDLAIFLSVLPRVWQLYIELKMKTLQTQQTLLTTTRHHLTAEGIDFHRSKTGASIPMAWDDELRAIVDEILSQPRKVRSIYLFANRDGGCYYNTEKGAASGFQSMWQRWQKKALEAGMSRRFTEHELLHKGVSDNPLSDASKARGHKDERTTRDIYQIRKPQARPMRSGRRESNE